MAGVSGRHVAVTPQPFKWLTPTMRRWAYGVAGAVVALCGVYGILDDSQGVVVLGLVAALLGLGTAGVHTPREEVTVGSDPIVNPDGPVGEIVGDE